VRRQRAFSPKPVSVLVRRFVERAGAASDQEPEEVMTRLVEAKRSSRRRTRDEKDCSCSCGTGEVGDRGVPVIGMRWLDRADSVAICSRFQDATRGRMRLTSASASTIAHEACHTFFYELVPELKFIPHERDEDEERLCNWGAAALLMPASSLRRRMKNVAVNLESLDAIAAEYAVSLPDSGS